jgi:anti-sigma factor RsiW
MRHPRLVASTLIAAAAAFTLAVPTSAAPLMTGSAALSQAAPSATLNVQHWRHGHRRHHYHGGGGGTGALIGGLAAGAIIGGAIAAGQAQAAQQAQQAHSYCAQRYRSYDPRSGTYLGYDGYRHPCP